MTRPLKLTQGFTLVELLVVIAIIGILAGFIAVGLPAALERAKIAKLENTLVQLRTILTVYYVDHGTFPPAYGYLAPLARDSSALQEVFGTTSIRNVSATELNDAQQAGTLFVFTRPWLDFLGQHNNEDIYDNFSIAYDTDRDGDISRLEFSPAGVLTDAATQNYKFDLPPYLTIYDPDDPGPLLNEQNTHLDSQDLRPILYFPINKRQFRKIAAEWFREDPNNPRPNDSEDTNDNLLDANFPPPNYDAYVLISVGPTANTWGMVHEFASRWMDQTNYDDTPAYYYHILGIATYFMATRDAENGGEGDGELDFDFRARTRRGQAEHPGNALPDRGGQNAPGPVIFVGEG